MYQRNEGCGKMVGSVVLEGCQDHTCRGNELDRQEVVVREWTVGN